MVTVAPGTGIGFHNIKHEIQVKEQETVNSNDVLLYTLELDRGKSGSSNEIEEDPYNALNQVNVKCSIDCVTDDQNIPVRGKY